MDGRIFTVHVGSDLWGAKHNLILPFLKRPSVVEMVESAQHLFDTKSRGCRPSGYPDVPYAVESAQILEPSGSWEAIGSEHTISSKGQYWLFQPESVWHSDAQGVMPPPVPTPFFWAPGTASATLRDTECTPPAAFGEKTMSVFYQLDAAKTGVVAVDQLFECMSACGVTLATPPSIREFLRRADPTVATAMSFQQFSCVAEQHPLLVDALFFFFQDARGAQLARRPHPGAGHIAADPIFDALTARDAGPPPPPAPAPPARMPTPSLEPNSRPLPSTPATPPLVPKAWGSAFAPTLLPAAAAAPATSQHPPTPQSAPPSLASAPPSADADAESAGAPPPSAHPSHAASQQPPSTSLPPTPAHQPAAAASHRSYTKEEEMIERLERAKREALAAAQQLREQQMLQHQQQPQQQVGPPVDSSLIQEMLLRKCALHHSNAHRIAGELDSIPPAGGGGGGGGGGTGVPRVAAGGGGGGGDGWAQPRLRQSTTSTAAAAAAAAAAAGGAAGPFTVLPMQETPSEAGLAAQQSQQQQQLLQRQLQQQLQQQQQQQPQQQLQQLQQQLLQLQLQQQQQQQPHHHSHPAPTHVAPRFSPPRPGRTPTATFTEHPLMDVAVSQL